MQRITITIILLLCLVFQGCNGRHDYREALSRAESVMDTNPDSALNILDSLNEYSSDFDRHFNMQYQLQLTNARMKSGVLFTTDSLTLSLVDYFDSNGTDDERALAYYIYGCSLVDLGQAPEALQAYYTALESIDTTMVDCSYNLLKAIYGQMSMIFDAQNLPQDEIWALNHYIDYVKKTSDSVDIYLAEYRMTAPYYLLNEIDSILDLTEVLYHSFKSIGADQDAAIIMGPTIPLYVDRGDLDKAKESMRIYEEESGLFEKNGTIYKGYEGYYVYKGDYELAINQLDSAEMYYRKSIPYDYLTGAYKGLLNVYRKRNNVDSIYHFSLLFEAAQNALHKQMRTTAIHQMSALYNYNRSQKEAVQEREKSRILKMYIFFITNILILIIALLIWLYSRNQKRKKRELAILKTRFHNTVTAHFEISSELQMLKSRNYDGIIAEKEIRECELKNEIEKLKKEIENYQLAKKKEPVDNIDAFLKSGIAKTFIEKANSKSDNLKITEIQWNLLQSQFCRCLPVLFKTFSEGKSLSSLQQQICILLILGIPEASMRKMLDCSKTVFSDAKSRSNVKLFGQNDARSLKNNLLKSLKGV